MNKNQKVFIFDFDGTIADSIPVLLEAYNRSASMLGLSKESLTSIQKYQTSGLKTLLKKVPRWKLPLLIWLVRGRLHRKIKDIQIYPGIHKTLVKLSDQGHELTILSNNSSSVVNSVLRRHRLQKYFSSVDCLAGGGDKSLALERLVKLEDYTKKDCYYVGDEVDDVNKASKAGIKTIAVTWGFNSTTDLEKTKPYKTIDKPEDLLKDL
jgi:phosphoglycolate phosphatase